MKACESQYCYLMSVAGWPFLWESRGKGWVSEAGSGEGREEDGMLVSI